MPSPMNFVMSVLFAAAVPLYAAVDCSALVGEWDWFTSAIVTFQEDHSILYNGQTAGKWECKDAVRNAAILRWTAGNFVDSITVSGDHIDGINQQGVVISGTRRQPPAPISPDFTTGYARGLKENRFVIMFFRDKSKFGDQQEVTIRKLRSDPVFSALFVFGESLLPGDALGLKAARNLKMDNLPAVSVFAPRPNELLEVSRHEGVYTFEEMRDDIPKSMCKAQQNAKIKLDDVTARLLRCVVQ